MGCTASKLDIEETVRRCKERRRLMKDAVYARHHLAAAHSDYCRCLRLTGAALYTFAAREPLAVADDTPAVLLNPTATANPQPPPHPPPPAAATSPKLPRIITSSAVTRRRKPPPKLPHILSESSLCSSPGSEYSNFFATAQQVQSTPTSQPPHPPPSAATRRRKPPPKLPHYSLRIEPLFLAAKRILEFLRHRAASSIHAYFANLFGLELGESPSSSDSSRLRLLPPASKPQIEDTEFRNVRIRI
ncbi:hypothetical protein E2542_SST05190 [Spatholobus suberectus]|nr:hypothetical protein E2542_SST05190 [Spatholobus suberectus]